MHVRLLLPSPSPELRRELSERLPGLLCEPNVGGHAELFRTYVGEAGDRGWGGRSSPMFVLSAVIVKDSEADALRDLRDQICTDLGKPTSTVLDSSGVNRLWAARWTVAGDAAGRAVSSAA